MNDKPMLNSPPDQGLVAHIVLFSHFLRKHGLSVSLSSVLDAIGGLELIDLSDPGLFRRLLRLNFVCRREDILRFDELFVRFWFPDRLGSLTLPAEGGDDPQNQADAGGGFDQITGDQKTADDDANETIDQWFARYSPDPVNRAVGAAPFTPSRDVYRSIKKWLQPLRNRLGRRSRYALRGREISLRRILRKNMQFGGEVILLDFKKKKQKKRKVLFFCDVSGSMDVYSLMLLHFIHALKEIDRQTEVFFFSTDLSRLTNRFGAEDLAAALSRLPGQVPDWGGGTRIGRCLRQFNRGYGRWMLTGKTIVVIFSDGWDRGETGLLKTQMSYLSNKAYRVIWLNPLVGTKDYQPICQGMRTALPYVDTFLPMGNPKDVQVLGKTLERMII